MCGEHLIFEAASNLSAHRTKTYLTEYYYLKKRKKIFNTGLITVGNVIIKKGSAFYFYLCDTMRQKNVQTWRTAQRSYILCLKKIGRKHGSQNTIKNIG